MRCCNLFVVVSIAGLLSSGVKAADPLAWLPAEVNAVGRVNVADLYKTPLAQKEGWFKKASESFVQQETFIPPGTNQILIGAELELSENLAAKRKFAVLVPDGQMTLEKLAPWLPGGIEVVSGKSVAQFGTDSFVADAGDGCWLTTSTSRQALSRWMRAGTTPGGGQVSRYLRMALNSKESPGQVMLAIDLQDNFSQQRIAGELKATDWFKSDLVVESNAKILTSIQGITIGIAVDNDRTGTAKIDFEMDAMALKPILEKLVEAVMHRVGVSTDDVQDWKWSVKGSQVMGAGPVSPGGARRLISILEPPSITQAISASSMAVEPTPETRMAKTSLKYCRSIQVLLDDLRETLKKTNDNHALYFERYARKIDDLPKLSVDGQLLDYSGKVSSSLRYQSQAQRMHNINAGTRVLETYSSSYNYVGPYGTYTATPNLGVGAAINAEENQAAKGVRFSEWKQIEDGLVVVRRAMTEKYQIEF